MESDKDYHLLCDIVKSSHQTAVTATYASPVMALAACRTEALSKHVCGLGEHDQGP